MNKLDIALPVLSQLLTSTRDSGSEPGSEPAGNLTASNPWVSNSESVEQHQQRDSRATQSLALGSTHDISSQNKHAGSKVADTRLDGRFYGPWFVSLRSQPHELVLQSASGTRLSRSAVALIVFDLALTRP